VSVDARGDVLALWQRWYGGNDTRTFYAWRPPRGEWTGSRRLGPAGQRVTVALTPFGQGTAVWNDGHGHVLSAEARPGGAFADPQVVASHIEANSDVNLALDDAGNAVTAWALDTHSGRRNAGSTIFAATRPAGGSWSAPERLSGDVAGGGPFILANAAGAAVVEWITLENGHVEISYRPPAGGFGPPERAPLTNFGSFPRIALSDDGRFTVAIPTGSFFTDVAHRTEFTTRSPLGDWAKSVEFASGGTPDALLAEPDGRVTFLIDYEADPNHPRVEVATRTVSGGLEGPTTLAPGSRDVRGAIDLRGDVMAGWQQTATNGALQVAERAAGAPSFGPSVTVAPDNLGQPAVALNDAGQAVAAWAGGSNDSPTAKVAVRDDPTAPALPFPPDLHVGLPDAPQLDGDGQLVIPVICSRPCQATPTGIVVPGRRGDASSGSGSSRRLRARRRGRVRIDFGRHAARAVRKALHRGRTATAYVSVRARGRSPRPITVSRRIRLR
jgi:hypothetical protein